MREFVLIILLLAGTSVSFAQTQNETVKTLLETYATQGAVKADAKQGEKIWQKTFKGKGDFLSRSCTSCHTKDLTQTGKHVKTNKEILPMAPSVNPQRLVNEKKINKWFKRNCKWTMGRECSAQEKSDMLLYIVNQSKF